jgi:hypothetical protein
VDVSEAVQITAADAEEELRDPDEDEAMTRRRARYPPFAKK